MKLKEKQQRFEGNYTGWMHKDASVHLCVCVCLCDSLKQTLSCDDSWLFFFNLFSKQVNQCVDKIEVGRMVDFRLRTRNILLSVFGIYSVVSYKGLKRLIIPYCEV